jgi:diguanylate cyclase (GGDEF)-like protein
VVIGAAFPNRQFLMGLLGMHDHVSDLDRCAQEPVHIIGHIQPHGLLFALSEPDLIVQQVSANISALLGMPPENILGRSFETVLGARQFETFRSKVLGDEPLNSHLLHVMSTGDSIEMNCIVHRQDGVLIAELELRQGAHSLEPLDLDTHIRIPLSRMELAADILELSRLATTEIQRLSGFDRVMIYRFDEEWNGKVIAETSKSLQVSYLGHCFPANDIPAQVRRLFLVNPIRAIADVAATPVPIVPEIGPLTRRPLDLTRSVLRSASQVHIQYLHNMKVQSSLTVSIIVEQRLWGMIACHHNKARRLDCFARSVCELIGQMLASQVAFRTETGALKARLAANKGLLKYMADLESSESLLHAERFQSAPLFDLFDADGLMYREGAVVSSQGATVEESLLIPVIGKLRDRSSRGIASSNMLSNLDPSAASYVRKVGGALYVGLEERTGDYLLLLRREIVAEVTWAGNPNKAVSEDGRGGLRPRASFAAWQETVRGRSRPWSELQLESARFLREQLLRLRGSRELSMANEALAAENTVRKKAEEDLRKSEAHLIYTARHDFLTGLPNRMLLTERFGQAILLAERHGKKVAALFVDLDGFKHVNDSLGHPIGDKLLQSVAKRLVACVRGSDTVSRQGGDEFVVLLSEIGQSEDAAVTAGRMLQAVTETHLIDQHDLHVTASIGVSVYPDDGPDAETLIKNADIAMYQAKENGRQGYQFFEQSMNVRAVERQWIEESLRLALKRQEFTLDYQPKINLSTGEITGAEALVRWIHPVRGFVSPAQFIPIAEDSGLIVPLGKWVLREACTQARGWIDAGLHLGTMAVNISAMEFRDEKFLESVFTILKETGLDPRSLELELTESVLMKRADSAASVLETLRASGIQVAVDDFGTGYSSLSYLRKFPIDILKIDQSFVREITSPPCDTTIVTAVIGMARSMNLRVVAEGVETKEALAFLRSHQCDEAQGYYFSRPLPAQQFAQLLKTSEAFFVAEPIESVSR